MYLLVIFLFFLFGFVLTLVLVVSLQLLLERAAPPNARSWNLECMATTSLVCILSYSSTMHTSSYSRVVVVCILCIASMETVYYARIY